MSPIQIRDLTAEGEIHPTPFLGPVNHTVGLKIDVSVLTADMVDQHGYLKAGVLIQQSGVPVNGAAQIAYGAIAEHTKVHTDNTTLAGVTDDVEVAVALYVLMNRDILEDSLGRALTADELAAVDAAGSHVAITPT